MDGSVSGPGRVLARIEQRRGPVKQRVALTQDALVVTTVLPVVTIVRRVPLAAIRGFGHFEGYSPGLLAGAALAWCVGVGLLCLLLVHLGRGGQVPVFAAVAVLLGSSAGFLALVRVRTITVETPGGTRLHLFEDSPTADEVRRFLTLADEMCRNERLVAREGEPLTTASRLADQLRGLDEQARHGRIDELERWMKDRALRRFVGQLRVPDGHRPD